jgi:hypothetical protein
MSTRQRKRLGHNSRHAEFNSELLYGKPRPLRWRQSAGLIRSAEGHLAFGICRPFGWLYISVHISIRWAGTTEKSNHRPPLPPPSNDSPVLVVVDRLID